MVQYRANGSYSRFSEGYHNFDVVDGIVVGLEKHPGIAKVLMERGLVRVEEVEEVEELTPEPLYGEEVTDTEVN